MSGEDHKVSKISSDAIFAVKPISPLKFILAFTVCFVLIFAQAFVDVLLVII